MLSIIMLWICIGVIVLNSFVLGMVLCRLSNPAEIELNFEMIEKDKE
jgi:hypothetical protein